MANEEVDREALGALLNAKWEYLMVTVHTDLDTDYGAIHMFDEAGANGWELVSTAVQHSNLIGTFKRRKI